MSEFRNKVKRQLEILGICLSQNYPGHLTTFDLADMFGVEELTIKRDLKELRSQGIDIHSVRGKGIGVTSTFADEKLKELIQQYTAIAVSYDSVDKSTGLLVNKLKEKALANLIVLGMCIESHTRTLVDYEKESSGVDFRREISPLRIFQRDNYWRILAIEKGIIKQFHLNKIIDARPTNYRFDPIPEESIDEMFKYSWRSWLGDQRYNVKLKFSHTWAERLLPKQLMEHEKITNLEDGSVIYETTVNSLDEIAGWIVSRGKGVVVLEPEELIVKVKELAQDCLHNYELS
jgi:predicted DNA-binding transcriptional regulator YafY